MSDGGVESDLAEPKKRLPVTACRLKYDQVRVFLSRLDVFSSNYLLNTARNQQPKKESAA